MSSSRPFSRSIQRQVGGTVRVGGVQEVTIIPSFRGGLIIDASGRVLPFSGTVTVNSSGQYVPTSGSYIYYPSTSGSSISGLVGAMLSDGGVMNTTWTNSPNTHTSGQVSQAAKVVTGVGTTFTQAMVGGLLTFANTSACVLVDKVNSPTQLIVNISGTQALQNYRLVYGGLQVDNSGGMIGAAGGITSLPDPEDPTDAANKRYVDYSTTATVPFSQGLRVGGGHYNTGLVSQAGTTVSGSAGATFAPSMSGGYLFVDGVGMAKITSYVTAQTLTVDSNRTYAGKSYRVVSPVATGTCSRSGSTITATTPVFSSTSVGGVLAFGDDTFGLILSVSSTTICVVDTLNPNENVLSFNLYSNMTSVVSSATQQRVLVLPDADDVLVGRNTVDTLTNKTFATLSVIDNFAVKGTDLSGSYYNGTVTQIAPARITTSGVDRVILDYTTPNNTITLQKFVLLGHYSTYSAVYTGMVKVMNAAGTLTISQPFSVTSVVDNSSSFDNSGLISNVLTFSDGGSGNTRYTVKQIGVNTNWTMTVESSLLTYL
jgi:hypothetical protein